MIIISHRGYENGEDPILENNPKQIQRLLDMGIDVEIDVSISNGDIFLGHDCPLYKIELDFLKQDGLWCHAKDIEALQLMLESADINCFWHQDDHYTVTSHGFIWTYPGMPLVSKSICVLPERYAEEFSNLKACHGVCTDYPMKYFKKGAKNG